jgi:hypothetical protein
VRTRLTRALALAALVAAGAGTASALPAAAGPPAVAAVVLPAAAADDLTWALAPGAGPRPDAAAVGATGRDRANYAYVVDPGDEVRDTLVVTNRSTTPLDLTAYATDALTTRDGGLDLLPAGTEPTDLGSWLTLDVPGGELSIPAGESVRVPFVLAVPDDASPGDHAGGVVTSLTQTVGDGALAVDRRLALRVHARVSGALSPGLEVRDVTVRSTTGVNPLAPATTTVTYTLANTGDARIVATEAVTVAGPGGSAPQQAAAELGELLPGAEVDRTVEVPGVRPLLRVAADVRVDGAVVGIGGGGATSAAGADAGWSVPWAALAVVVLVVAGVVTWFVRRPLAPEPAPASAAEPPAGSTGSVGEHGSTTSSARA